MRLELKTIFSIKNPESSGKPRSEFYSTQGRQENNFSENAYERPEKRAKKFESDAIQLEKIEKFAINYGNCQKNFKVSCFRAKIESKNEGARTHR